MKNKLQTIMWLIAAFLIVGSLPLPFAGGQSFGGAMFNTIFNGDVTNAVVACKTATSTELLAADAATKFIWITNSGAEDAYYLWEEQVASTTGHLLKGDGGFVLLSPEVLTRSNLNCIGETATASLRISYD